MNVNFYAQRFVGRALDVNNLPATVEGTGEATQISGRFVITDYTGGGDQVGIFYLMPEDAHNEFYAAMETDPNFADREFNFPMYTVGVADLFEQTTDDMWDEIEVQHLQSQFDLPSAEHPLGPHTGYKLDSDLDAVLREQMIEGGVPEDEVQPSIDDIEEAMDERINRKDDSNGRITNMEDNTKTGADILNTPSETPRYDAPFEQPEEDPAEGEFTEEDYASVPQEINDQVIKVIREMRAAGTPMPEIMRHAREIIEAYLSTRTANVLEGGKWFAFDGGLGNSQTGNYCEECVQAGKAPEGIRPVGQLPEANQIACMTCNNQEGSYNREYGPMSEKMPQHPKLPGVGTIPIDLDVVRQTPNRGRDDYDRKRDYYSSVERLSIPDEHLGW